MKTTPHLEDNGYVKKLEDGYGQDDIKMCKCLKNRTCPHCGRPVVKSDTPGYIAQCYYCDEDFYDVELGKPKKKDTPVIILPGLYNLCIVPATEKSKNIQINYNGCGGVLFEKHENNFDSLEQALEYIFDNGFENGILIDHSLRRQAKSNNVCCFVNDDGVFTDLSKQYK